VRTIAEYLESRGRPIPSHYNPSDWLMDIAQTIPITDLENEGFFHDVTMLPEPAGSLMNDPNRISLMIKDGHDEKFGKTFYISHIVAYFISKHVR
jgi:hypothetical protein